MIDVELEVEAFVGGIIEAQKRIGRNVPRALAQGANMIASQAKQEHGYKDQSGVLTNSIASDGVKGSFGSGTLEATVSAGAAHAVYMEFGTKPHKIRPKYRKALRFPAPGGGFVFAKEVDHPGTPAFNFLADALEHELGDITGEIEAAMELSFLEAGF